MNEDKLRMERMSLLIGTIIGQMSELLNNIKLMSNEQVCCSLLDIHNAAALQIHEIYYKGNKPG